MTSSELAQVEEAQPSTMGAELVRQEHTDGWIPVLQPIMQLANAVAGTEFVPSALRDNPEAVGACILFGREIDVAPMHALQNIHIIEGRPSVSAEQMRAMVLAAGHEIAFGETSGAMCQIKGRRRGSTTWTTVEWTLAMAEAASLTGKKNWRLYRGDMLIARASAKLCRMIFADVVRGMRTTEELEDEADGSAAPVAAGPVKSGTSKVSRAGRKATQPAPAAPVPSSAPAQVDIAPPPPPPAPAPAAEQDKGAEITAANRQCPVIYNGQQCTHDASHVDHDIPHQFVESFLASPPEELDEHGQEFIPDPEDESLRQWQAAHDAAAEAAAAMSGPVPVGSKPMHASQTKLLQARFKALGFTDEPDDREARLRVASTILGRGETDQVETFRATGDGSMSYDEADWLMQVLAPCKSRDDVLALLIKITQDQAAEEDQA